MADLHKVCVLETVLLRKNLNQTTIDLLENPDCKMETIRYIRACSMFNENIYLTLWVTKALNQTSIWWNTHQLRFQNFEDFTFLPYFGTLSFLVMTILSCEVWKLGSIYIPIFQITCDVYLDCWCLMLLFCWLLTFLYFHEYKLVIHILLGFLSTLIRTICFAYQ